MIIVWTMEDCPRCEDFIDIIADTDQYEIRKLENLTNGKEPDVDALVHLMMIESVAPMVKIDEKFLSVEEVNAILERKSI